MDTDFPVWLLVLIPVFFGLGWIASRIDLRQLRTENRSAPKAYFKGLNYLLNEQQDQAVDAFIEAIQKDPDTTELHFAVGNLFRRRGEYERAVRVHRHLLSRSDLSSSDHDRAQYDLALDFLRAGLLDHAETALHVLENSPTQANKANAQLLGIYERTREWQNAEQTAQAVEAATQQDLSKKRAHFWCELAATALQQQRTDEAKAWLEKAAQIAPHAARPRIKLAELARAQGDHSSAYAQLQQTLQDIPAFAPLVAASYANAAVAVNQQAQAAATLQALHDKSPSIDLIEALVWLDQQAETPAATSSQRYTEYLQKHPSLIAAARWLDREKLQDTPEQTTVGRALQTAIRPLARYRCAACGFEAQQHYWHCPGCQSWDSYPPRRIEEL